MWWRGVGGGPGVCQLEHGIEELCWVKSQALEEDEEERERIREWMGGR